MRIIVHPANPDLNKTSVFGFKYTVNNDIKNINPFDIDPFIEEENNKNMDINDIIKKEIDKIFDNTEQEKLQKLASKVAQDERWYCYSWGDHKDLIKHYVKDTQKFYEMVGHGASKEEVTDFLYNIALFYIRDYLYRLKNIEDWYEE